MDGPEKGVPLANIVELRMALLWDIREPHWDGWDSHSQLFSQD